MLSGSPSLGIPPAAVAPYALTVSASAAVAGVVLAAVSAGLGVAWAARRRHGPTPRASSTSPVGSRGDASAPDRPEAGAVSPGRLPSGKPIPPMSPAHGAGCADEKGQRQSIRPVRNQHCGLGAASAKAHAGRRRWWTRTGVRHAGSRAREHGRPAGKGIRRSITRLYSLSVTAKLLSPG